MKIIVTKGTMDILNTQATKGEQHAIERISEYNSMEYEEKDGYYIFYDKTNENK